MATKPKTQSVTLAGGGKATIVPNERGMGAVIVVTRGYKETPEQRRERLAAGNRSRRFTPETHKVKGGRAGGKRKALAEYR